MKNRGFTLVELLIGTAIGSSITLGAVAFVAHQSRAIADTTELIEISEVSRFGIERLAGDLRLAGAGVGYTEAGRFAGLAHGTFQVGQATFVSDNFALDGGGRSDDIGILAALGGHATIASYDPAGRAQVCTASGLRAGDLAVFRSEDGLSARSVRIDALTPAVCSDDTCVGGCENVVWSDDQTWSSGPSALTASYAGGVASGQLQWVTWFVDDADPQLPGVGRLRRAEGPCVRRDSSCGELMADDVESVQIRRWAHRDGQWVDVTSETTPLATGSRMRVDVELVFRARQQGSGIADRVHADLEDGQCFPDCTAPADRFARRRVATSVEVKNTGRGTYRRGR